MARFVDQRTVDLALRPTINYSHSFTLTGRTQLMDMSTITGRVVNIIFIGQSTNNNGVPGNYSPLNGANICNLSIAHGGAVFNDAKPLLASDLTDDHHGRRLADDLIQNDMVDNVIITMAAYGGSLAAEWTPGGHYYGVNSTYVDGDLAYRIGLAARCIANAGLSHVYTIIDWQQGEWDSDAGTSQVNYAGALNGAVGELRRVGLLGFPHQAMFIHKCTRPSSPQNYRAVIRAAQVAVCNGADVFEGADMDAIGVQYRPDGTHFSEEGAAIQASLKMAAYSGWLNNVFG